MTNLYFIFLVFDVKDLSMSGYLRGLDESGWLKHIKNVMDTSLFIAKVFLSFHLKILTTT